MAYQLPPDISQQVQFYIESGNFACEEDVLREALKALSSRGEHQAARQDGIVTMELQTAISEMEAGDQGRPLREVAAEIRKLHNFSH